MSLTSNTFSVTVKSLANWRREKCSPVITLYLCLLRCCPQRNNFSCNFFGFCLFQKTKYPRKNRPFFFNVVFVVSNSNYSPEIKNNGTFSLLRLCYPWILGWITRRTNGHNWKRGFRALSKLAYLETKLLELIESSILFSEKLNVAASFRRGRYTPRGVDSRKNSIIVNFF